jgi:hypothetical protein
LPPSLFFAKEKNPHMPALILIITGRAPLRGIQLSFLLLFLCGGKHVLLMILKSLALEIDRRISV